ncbi:MAG TPA: TetR/AcrR family transcriptional regulator [Kofleriaceae bacterium]|jgi:AcrR family transcriptional regulator
MPVRLAEVVRDLPRHAHALPRRTVQQSQRWRLLEAVVEVTARAGYADATIADVIAVAGVSRKTFYEHFADKEAAFLATYDVVADRLIELLVTAGAAHADPDARRTAHVERFLKILDRDHAVARVFMVDVQGAGPAALRRRAAVNERFADALFGDARVPKLRRDAVVGGVNQVVAAALLAPRPKSLTRLAAPLVAFVRAALA